MKSFSAVELAEIFEKHRLWLNEEEGGERADLRYANLRYANLRSVNLSYADLSSADLSYANLRYANLRYADLSSADLSSVNLSYADLSSADLSYANLRYANLRSVNLSYADLSSADLLSANLRYADLRSADLSYADLSYADLRSPKSLWGATGNMSEVKSVQCDIWPVTYTATHMQIGCQFHDLAEWWGFDDEEISRMDQEAAAWWSVWKPILKTIIEASPAKPIEIIASE